MILRNPQNLSSCLQPTHPTLGHRYVPNTLLGVRSQRQLGKTAIFSTFKTRLSSPASESSNLSSTRGAATGATRDSISNIGNGMEYTSSGLARRTYVDEYGTTSPADDTADAPRVDYTYMSQQEQSQLDREGGHHTQDEGYIYNRIVSEGERRTGGGIPSSTGSRMESETGAVRGGARGTEMGARSGVGFTDMANVAAEISPVNISSAGYDIDSDEIGEGVGMRTGDEDHPSQEDREGTQGVLMMTEAGQGQGQTPTWSETKTKAGKDRKRLPLACIACRRKKIRCSGENPACRHCVRSRTPCVYKQSTRKAAPRTDYMAMLDRRLKRMEERLIKNVPKEEVSAVLSTTGRSVVRPSISTTSARAGAPAKKRTAATAFGDELDIWARGDSSTARKGTGIPETWGDSPLGAVGRTDADDGSHALPPKDIQEHLAEVFFDYVYGQPYFVLHKPSFMRRLRSGTAPAVLVLAVCAVSARFSKHPAVRHDPPFLAGEAFASEARRQILKKFDTPNVTNVTVCVLLGLHEFGTCQGGRSWAMGGMATRMAHAIQLHKEANNDPLGKPHSRPAGDYFHQDEGGYMSFVDREIRRRSMWSCFILDRFTSSGTERPHLIAESEIEVQLPVHDRNLELDIPAVTEQLDGTVKGSREEVGDVTGAMGVTAYMVRVVALYGRVVKYLNQGGKERDPREIWEPNSQFASLNKEISQFENSLPSRLRYTPENMQVHITEHLVGQFVFVHIALHQVRLFLNKSGVPTPTPQGQSSPLEFGKNAGEIALSSATEISRIILDAEERGVLVVAPFTGYCAFNASMVHMVRMFSFSNNREIQEESRNNMQICLRFLMQLRQYWGLFHAITDNLKRLYRSLADSLARGSSFPEETTRTLQYGDWFQKYPRGVNASDYKEMTSKPHTSDGASTQDAVLSQKSNLQTADEFFARLGPSRHNRSPAAPPAPAPHAPKAPIQSYIRTSPPIHSQTPSTIHPGSSPGSLHHSQSPTTHHSPMGASPATIPTPTMAQSHGKMEGNLDPQLLSPPQISNPQGMSRQASLYRANYQQQTQSSQHNPAIPSMVPDISSHQVPYPNYPIALPRGPAGVGTEGMRMHHPQQQQQQHSQSAPSQYFLYDLYSSGSDPAFVMAATTLNSGIWPELQGQVSGADVDAFTEQPSSAWFLPFNSCPPDFEPGIEGMESINITGAGGSAGAGAAAAAATVTRGGVPGAGGDDGGGVGGRRGGEGGSGGGLPHLISRSGQVRQGGGTGSSATAYHDHNVR
ncbi:unnamed protein product [Tuber aestivum]|uniref:Zn(2)-C6 fungal-type domain-containing protein n=1 Tax=Tuber aestivum TaxID=59557 RepID=A0A292PQ02_9PEZI|nr:unnamed protein product [Tuber aestivum]